LQVRVPITPTPAPTVTLIPTATPGLPPRLVGHITWQGRPAQPLYVIVFPSDKALWIAGSRRVLSARSSDTGAYKLANLPPGDYYLCALSELETVIQSEPAYLEQLVAASVKLTLGEGEKKTQNLRIGK